MLLCLAVGRFEDGVGETSEIEDRKRKRNERPERKAEFRLTCAEVENSGEDKGKPRLDCDIDSPDSSE